MGIFDRRLKKTAAEYLARRPPCAPAELPQLLADTRTNLRELHPSASDTAIRCATLGAWSERAAAQSRCWVDLDASTPQLLVLVDDVTKQRRLFPAADLVRILGPRAAAA